ncbi:Oxoglutarate and iron-dependent oxygenase degradation C-term-domain-containing protein [Roridomyces roridus]|uniref:uS12 prolyl 3,4-dihydroxylase n=1 Tax=Roridomyces roridus TaxID=1738132 RepID=A0AAD7FUB0_9AGAR|nr:Oxoglutarate and iron-dependent oxygenase degradation C-term-domain-containing protein [Roridomyces roridus]
MARTHRRDSSPAATDAVMKKKFKSTNGNALNGSTLADPTAPFADDLLSHGNIAQLHAGYASNEPYKYAVVEKLFQDDLLRKVKDECLSELNFTEKETDIYKINQTGDLASLNYLTSSQISLLPNLLTLRDALYSPVFRQFLRAVTGCGPLSGTKQDMSVNSYTRGCHLLNHDDVIGSRRVSYILYMPLPHFQFWQKDWGGALELYPTVIGADGEREPVSVPSKSIPPSWNQFIFFEVQPGQSFHSVEEVVVGGEGEDGRARLSISGWFHAAQEGEEGYVPEDPSNLPKSSREQLTLTSTQFKSYPGQLEQPPEDTLSEEHVAFLSEFLNPVYLQPRTMKALAARFVEESSLELHSFLCNDLSSALEPRLRELDTKDGLGEDRAGRVPSHTSGTGGAWSIKGPPHKWRYCTLLPHTPGSPVQAVLPRAAASSDEILRGLQDELFPSTAFRAWLAIVSRLLPMRHCVEARRFRPGLDYTLATSEEKEARLDVVLGLTPDVRPEETEAPPKKRSSHKNVEVKARGWQAAEWGGWECYMAPHDEEDDPAVYRAGSIKKPRASNGNGASSSKEANGKTNGNGHAPSGEEEEDEEADASMDDEEQNEEEEEEDSTLLTVQPGFNRLLLVLRDERVMRFVKYVSASAEGSRWDLCGEYEVGMMEEEDMEEDD